MRYRRWKGFRRAGTITLFYNEKEIAMQNFQSTPHRKEIIDSWDKKYQFKKASGTIYIQVAYD